MEEPLNESVGCQSRLVIDHFSDAEAYENTYSDPSPVQHFFSMRLLRVRELLDRLEGKRVLDVGCGPGVIAESILKAGNEYTGMDLSPNMISACTKRLANWDSAHFLVGRMENLPFPDRTFDVLLCLGTIEYSDDPVSAIREFGRVMKERAVLVISMLNPLSPYRVWHRHARGLLRARPLGRLGDRGLANLSLARIARRRITLEPRLDMIPERKLVALLQAHRLSVNDAVYYDFNLFLRPLDVMFPSLAMLSASRLESLGRGPLRGLGTAFVLRASKCSPSADQA